MSGSPRLTPLATPIASTSGTGIDRRLGATAPARPPVRRACRRSTTCARPPPARRRAAAHCSISSIERHRVADGADRGRAADRDRVRRRAGVAAARRSAPRGRSRARPNDCPAAPVKWSWAPNIIDSSWLPVGTSGRSPDSTRWTSSPSTAPAAAVMRQWFDCAAPTVTSERAPAAMRRPAQELELAGLVAAHPEPGEVVALHPQPRRRRAAAGHVRAGWAASPVAPAAGDRTRPHATYRCAGAPGAP